MGGLKGKVFIGQILVPRMQIDPTITIKFCDSGSMPLTAANTWHYPHQKCSHHFQTSLTVTQNCPSMSKLSLNIDSVTKPSSVRAEAHTQKSCTEISTKISSEMLTCWGVNTKDLFRSFEFKDLTNIYIQKFLSAKNSPSPWWINVCWDLTQSDQNLRTSHWVGPGNTVALKYGLPNY